ncbi:MAG: hypothetical protein QG573_2470, partial [Acidobacteriota bacterium]|nr:hypothetical protein [Acidobacteriota bacterium]
KSNHAVISAKLTHIDISELFKEYENFGQDALTYKNIGGRGLPLQAA